MGQLPESSILFILEDLQAGSWEGIVWRIVFGDRDPDTPNSLGARWNPRGIEALYTSLCRDTVIAEGEHLLNASSPRPKVERYLYELSLRLDTVLDLSQREVLEKINISDDAITDDDHTICRRVGEAVIWLGYQGMIVPSARGKGANLVVFPQQCEDGLELSVLGKEKLP